MNKLNNLIQKKHFKLLSFAIFFSILSISHSHGKTNRTFFMPRTINQDLVIQSNMSQHFINEFEETINSPEQMDFFANPTVFYQSSTSSNKLCKYFFPENKTELIISGKDIATKKDIAAEWFFIADNSGTRSDNFESKISIRPEYKSFGLNINLNQKLNFISNKLLLSVNLPFVQVKTDIQLKEYDVKNAPTSNPYNMPYHNPTNVTEYFNNSTLKYSKLKNGILKLNDLADIKVKFSYEIKRSDSLIASIYGQTIIPTGQKPTAEYLFEPIAGNGGHFAIGLGANLEFEIFENFNLLATVDYNYLFETSQLRTFDLNNGPWSRYLLLVTKDQFPINGVNILTQDCNIKPKSQFQTFIAIHYLFNSFHFELGHNLWYKSAEDVELRNAFPSDIGIAALKDGTINGNTLQNAKISTNPDQDGTAFTPIKQEEINISSGTHPSSLSNKFYASSGFEGKFKDNPYQANIGFAYEFGKGNETLNDWSIWLSLNFTI